MSLLCPSPSGERRKNAEKIEILESLKKITISEDFAVLKKNRERVLSALIKNKYPDISKSLKKNKEQTGANR